MVNLVTALKVLGISNDDIDVVLSIAFDCLNSHEITICGLKPSVVKVFSTDVHKTLVEFFQDEGVLSYTRLKFSMGTVCGDRLKEDIRSWHYIGSTSGLEASMKSIIYQGPSGSRDEFYRSYLQQPALTKALLTQLK